jgi:hypothetical protein
MHKMRESLMAQRDETPLAGEVQIDCLFRRNWTAIPAQTGHLIRRKLDGCSR